MTDVDKHKSLRLAFMGSPDFSVQTLLALIGAGHEIACVYTQPPKPAGRGKKLKRTAVHDQGEALGLPVRTPKSLRKPEEQAEFAALDLDAAVVIAYGLILPQAILDAPRLGCMNLHGSILPRWRGAAPIQRAIMAGDEVTGVQAMMMEAGLDTGPVLATETVRIFAFDTAGDLHDRLAGVAAELAPRALAGLADGSLDAQVQTETGATYAEKITSADQKIGWTCDARAIDCQIRGLSPFPGAWFHWQADAQSEPLRMKVLLSAVEPGPVFVPPGTVLDDRLAVACGSGGAVRLLKLQRPGARPMDAAEFLRGSPVPAGTMFG